jgi:NAD(P)-dependent dehydrogenase (short-subunit alcohol dehydrogenase family)
MPTVVITGVSTGIGYAATEVLVREGFHVFGSVRQQADAERLAAEFGERFTPLIFDVTDEPAIATAAQTVREALAGTTLAGLVNNAGIAVAGPLLELPVEELRRQMEINLVGPFLVTQAFAPLLGADRSLTGRPGRIVNISSMTGVQALPFLGPYCASKFSLEGYSESLRRELLLYGIDVIVIGPGPIKTAIWDKAEEMDTSRYVNSPYGPILEKFKRASFAAGQKGYPAARIGKLVHTALTTAHPKVRYAAVKSGALEKLVKRFGSPRLLDRIIGRQLGMR